MKKWGLGIEHEMRIRFQKNISELSKKDKDIFFPEFDNKYIFVSSTLLLYYFYLYEIILMKNFDKYVKSEEEQKYLNKVLLKIELYKLAKNKLPFPIENKNILNTVRDQNNINDFIEYLNFYIMIYTLYNAPFLLFTYNINNEATINIYILSQYNNLIQLLYSEPNDEVIYDYLNNMLLNLYNNNYELNIINGLKNIFNTKNIKGINLEYEYYFNSNLPIINIIVDNYNNTSKNNNINTGKNNINKYTINKFFKDLDNYSSKIRNIFENGNIEISGIDNEKFYKNLFKMYKNRIPENDLSSKTTAIEFKTVEFENLNYEFSLNTLIEYEKTFFYIINSIPIIKKYTDMFGDLSYHNIGSIDSSLVINDIIHINYSLIDEDYTGSYHIWCTAPYVEKMSMKQFLNIHSTLANKLQLLEPLLACHYSSPSYDALIDSKIESKSSLRQFLNGYSNYGTSDVSLMNGTKKHTIYKYYLSEDDILNDRTVIPAKKLETNIYDFKGHILINYDKLNTRGITNNLFIPLDKGNTESNNSIKVNNYFTMIFEKTYIRPKTFEMTRYGSIYNNYLLHLGADIRTRDMSEYVYPLNKEWERKLLMKNNKLIEVYYNKTTKKISYERIYNKNKSANDRIGFEFRIFDHFPTAYLNQILGILVPLVLDSYKNPRIIKMKTSYISKQFWHNEMVNVILNGYQYTVGKEYLKNLEKEFNIKFDFEGHSLKSEIVLEEIYNKLCNKYKKTHKNSLFNKMKFKTPIKFINFNKKAWEEIINRFFREHPQMLRKIMYSNKNIRINNISEILGKEHNYNLQKIKKYIENISENK